MSARRVLPVVVAPPAAFEIVDAVAAYEATRPGLGRAFVEELRAARFRIEDDPGSCPRVHRSGLRRALVHRFPYGVIYRVTGDATRILGLLPARADPVGISQIGGKSIL